MTELKAGRELDAHIAELVMEYNVLWRGPTDPWMDSLHCGLHVQAVPRYSTNIAAAWQVVDHMIDTLRIPFWEMAYRPFETHRGAKVNFMGDPRYDVMAETVPLAICLAALKALGQKEAGE